MHRTPGPLLVLLTALTQAAACSAGVGGRDEGSGGGSEESGTTETGAGSSDTDTEPNTLTDTETDTEDTDTATATDEPCEQTDCEGECVDLDSSSDHCGSCGYSCLGGACVAGECEAATLATNKGRLFMVEVDEEHVYYGGSGVFIGRMGVDGSEDTTINAGTELCETSALTPNALLWGSVESMGLRGCITPDCVGGVVQFYDGVETTAIAYSEPYSRLFWAQGGSVLTREWPGGELTTFVTGQAMVLEFELSPTHLYWRSLNNQGNYFVRRADLLGEMPAETLIGPRPGIANFAVDDTHLYWSEEQRVYSMALADAPLAGEPALFNQAPAPIVDLVADDTHLYWAAVDENGEGYIERCELGQCPVPKRIDEPTRPWSLAIGELGVYWVTETGVVGAYRR